MKSVRAQAEERIAAAEAAFERAEGAWSGVGISLGSLFGGAPKAQTLSAIRQMRELGYESWRKRAGKLADGDAAGWRAWVAEGNALLANLASTAQEAEGATLQGMVFDTVAVTASTVAEGATAAARTLWSNRTLLLIAAALAAALFVAVRMRVGVA